MELLLLLLLACWLKFGLSQQLVWSSARLGQTLFGLGQDDALSVVDCTTQLGSGRGAFGLGLVHLQLRLVLFSVTRTLVDVGA